MLAWEEVRAGDGGTLGPPRGLRLFLCTQRTVRLTLQ